MTDTPTPQQRAYEARLNGILDRISENRHYEVNRDIWLTPIYGCTEESKKLKLKVRKLNQAIAKKAPGSASGALKNLKAAQHDLIQLKAYRSTLELAMAFVLDDPRAQLHWQTVKVSYKQAHQAAWVCLSLVQEHRKTLLFRRTEWGRDWTDDNKLQDGFLADAIMLWVKPS